MRTTMAAVAALGLIVGVCGGLMLSEVIGIIGVLLFDRAVGVRFLPVYLGVAAAAAAPILAAMIRKRATRGR
jgi:hypothetical protein